jgi:hypothetical protein
LNYYTTVAEIVNITAITAVMAGAEPDVTL